MKQISPQNIDEFKNLKLKKDINYEGDITLLSKKKVSIVGARKALGYTKNVVNELARKLAKNNVVVISGAALGVDIVAHRATGFENTIAVLPSGLNNLYPATNKKDIIYMQEKALVLSQFENDFKATPYSFVARNELVVALGDVLVVGECELKSGSMRSVEFALKMQKKIYVLPHRLGESSGTSELVKKGLAEPILDIDEFVKNFCGKVEAVFQDDFLEFCRINPSYEDVVNKFKSQVFEYELMGKIKVQNNRVVVL